ncbi:hypothetical protein L0F63_000109, partial [Massospora cicadina]
IRSRKAVFATQREKLIKALERKKAKADTKQFNFGPLAHQFRFYIADAAKFASDYYTHARRHADNYYAIVAAGTDARHRPSRIHNDKVRSINHFIATDPIKYILELNKFNQLDSINSKSDPRIILLKAVLRRYFTMINLSLKYFNKMKHLADEYQRTFL